MHNLHPSPTDTRLETLAARSAGRKLGWYIHAGVYLLVNAGLTTLALSQGQHWSIYPAISWGVGLLAHGASVWLLAPQGSIWRSMVEREKKKLQGNA